MITVSALMWVSWRGNVSLWCLIMSVLYPEMKGSWRYMCSSDNTVQLGVEAEWGLMMFTHHTSALSTQDALKIHSQAHIQTQTFHTLQRHGHALLLGSVKMGAQTLMHCFVLWWWVLSGGHFSQTAFDRVSHAAGSRYKRQPEISEFSAPPLQHLD